MSAGKYTYDAFRADLGDMPLPDWDTLPEDVQELWTTGPTEGRFPGTATLEWVAKQGESK